jgi:sugar lactone lactonase YvrE
MRSISYFNQGQWAANQPNVVPANAPIIIASDETEANANFKSFIAGKYVTQTYVLRWWFPEELYKTNNEGDFGKAIAWMTSPAFTRYLLYRDTGLPLGSTNFTLHVRNDLAPKTGLAAPSITNVPEATQPTEEVTSTVKINLFAGGPAGRQNGQLNKPRGIAQDANGNFYVVDTGNFRVQKYDKDGNYLAKTTGGKGNGDGQFAPINESSTDTGPSGIAVDKAGNIYVADVWNHRIQKFDKDLKFVAKWGSFISLADSGADEDAGRDTKMYGPRGVAVGPDGNEYVTDTGNKRVLVFSPEGRFLRKIDSGMSPNRKPPDYPFTKPGEFNEPLGIAVDASGNVYVADTNNRRIQKFDNTGKYVTSWGSVFDAGQEPFLAVDSAGNVYTTGPASSAVLKYNSSGQLQGQKSKNGASTLKTPSGIVVGPDGTNYVMDISQNTAVNLGTIP